MQKKLRIEIVAWEDAVSQDDWSDISGIEPECHKIVSVGLYLGENDEALTLALNFDQSGEKASCVMHIPIGMIKHRSSVLYSLGPNSRARK